MSDVNRAEDEMPPLQAWALLDLRFTNFGIPFIYSFASSTSTQVLRLYPMPYSGAKNSVYPTSQQSSYNGYYSHSADEKAKAQRVKSHSSHMLELILMSRSDTARQEHSLAQ